MEAEIPDKLFFRIGEVARLAALRPSVLRFWETEFSELQPQKSRSGQRLYSREEVGLVFEIKRLLYSDRLTIKGAKRALRRRKGAGEERGVTDEPSITDLMRVIEEVKSDLLKLRDTL